WGEGLVIRAAVGQCEGIRVATRARGGEGEGRGSAGGNGPLRDNDMADLFGIREGAGHGVVGGQGDGGRGGARAGDGRSGRAEGARAQAGDAAQPGEVPARRDGLADRIGAGAQGLAIRGGGVGQAEARIAGACRAEAKTRVILGGGGHLLDHDLFAYRVLFRSGHGVVGGQGDGGRGATRAGDGRSGRRDGARAQARRATQ